MLGGIVSAGLADDEVTTRGLLAPLPCRVGVEAGLVAGEPPVSGAGVVGVGVNAGGGVGFEGGEEGVQLGGVPVWPDGQVGGGGVVQFGGVPV